jgi:deazaflavin-dependent oxidoreductase (nitroreductase family)
MTPDSPKFHWWQGFIQQIAALKPFAWLLSRSLHHIDRSFFQLSQGRYSLTSFLSGQKICILTSVGARSGKTRRTPLLYITDKNLVVLIATNWGQPHHPAWFYNLLANPEAYLSFYGNKGFYIGREANEIERKEYWQKAVNMYAGYEAYSLRTGDRKTPIMILTPKHE